MALEWQLVVRDEGDVRRYSVEEYIEAGGSDVKASTVARRVYDFENGDLEDRVTRMPEVVDRARDEDCFYARVRIPGWLTDHDDDLPDIGHPGGSAEFGALIEDYSEDAWRVVGREQNIHGDVWFTWCWEFLPKSSVKVTTGEGDALAGRKIARAAVIGDEDWEEGLERVTSSP